MDSKAFLALLAVALLLGCTQPSGGTQKPGPQAPANPVPAAAPEPVVESQAPPAETPKEETNVNPNAVVEKGDKTRVFYKGTFDDGIEFDSTAKNGNRPLEFVAGAGMMIPGFDAAVLGMKVGEEKTIRLEPKDAYGLAKPELVKEFQLSELKKQGLEPKVGDSLYAEGASYPLKVVEVTSTAAKVDFNHPMAGKALNFWIKIEHIKKPEAASAGGKA